MGIFNAYDIRGVYGSELDEDVAFKIGYFLPQILKTNKILVGRDGRVSSPSLFNAICNGITFAGACVYDAGITTTPMVYYLTSKYEFLASVQITASHNDREYNGFKVCKYEARSMGYNSGLNELEKLINEGKIVKSDTVGIVIPFEKREEYVGFLKAKFTGKGNLKVVIDCSNGAVCNIIKDIMGVDVIYINDVMDGTFPGHPPNPLIEANTEQLKEMVKEHNADLGVIYDGDGDRVAFVDEFGKFISPDLIIAVLAIICKEKDGDIILHDIRTSKSVSDYIEKLGCTWYMWKVGYSFAKEKLREIGAVVGGELAGHYYFREFMNCDSGILASIKVIDEINKSGSSISNIIKDIVKYSYSGEINFKVLDKERVLKDILEWAKNQEQIIKIYDFDGYRIEYNDWWFNVRTSNTENYLRLVVEAKNDELMTEKVEEIKKIIF